MYLAQKIELDPTEKQKQELYKYFGFSRYLFNKGKDIWEEMYKKSRKNGGPLPNASLVTSELRKFKEDWWNEYSAIIVESSVKNLAIGYDRFRGKVKKRYKTTEI